MKKIGLCIIYFLLLNNGISIAQQYQTSKYLPIEDQIIYSGNILSLDDNKKGVTTDVNTIPHDSSFLKMFSKTLSSVSIFSVDSQGNLTVVGNTLSAEKTTYHVIYEYSMFQPINVGVSDSTTLTYCVGIGVRLVATITTLKANVDLSKIISLVAATGGTNKFSGQIQISLTGINSQTLTNLCPIPPNGATFTADNVATSLQAVAAIKSHFSDKDVTIVPEVLGVYITGGTPDKDTYAKSVKSIKAANLKLTK